MIDGALARFGLTGAAHRLVAARENHVYAVDLPGGGKAALRLHRPGYHGEGELLAELTLLADLAAAGLAVPRPLPATDGSLLVALGQEPATLADLLSWCPGQPLGASGQPLALVGAARTDAFAALGRTLARLHLATDGYGRPFERPVWDRDGLVGEQPVWGRFWDHPAVAPDDASLLLAFRADVRRSLGAAAFDQGIIHADPVRENVLIDGGEVALIDFDDCGTGFRGFDLATALLPNLAEPDFADLSAALLDGYRATRPLPCQPADLPLFLALRSATYLGWIATRPNLPDACARTQRYLARTIGLIRAL